MAVIGPFCAVADLRGLRVSGPIGWLLWGLPHLAFMPANENRLTLLTKWLWAIGTRQRASLLITGRPDQPMGVEVGLARGGCRGQPHGPFWMMPTSAGVGVAMYWFTKTWLRRSTSTIWPTASVLMGWFLQFGAGSDPPSKEGIPQWLMSRPAIFSPRIAPHSWFVQWSQDAFSNLSLSV